MFRRVIIRPFSSRKELLPGLLASDRLKHKYVTGQTGSGKSEVLKYLIYRHAKRASKTGERIILIDPHGDLSEEILRLQAFGDVRTFLFDPALRSTDGFVSLNPLDAAHFGKAVFDDNTVDVVSSELARVFKEIMPAASFSLQMEALLVPCIATVLRLP